MIVLILKIIMCAIIICCVIVFNIRDNVIEIKAYKKQIEEAKKILAEYEGSIDDRKQALNILDLKFQDLQNGYKELEQEIETYKAIQGTINESIAKKRHEVYGQDSNRIIISDSDLWDIENITSLLSKIHNKELINKLVYKSYIEKPLKQMISRVLHGYNVSGIYKITYIPTGESYIGKAYNVDKRWIEHVKSAFDIGAIAHSNFYVHMREHGVENYTFELIEEVKKEDLSKREKFWISYYDTKNVGFNERLG